LEEIIRTKQEQEIEDSKPVFLTKRQRMLIKSKEEETEKSKMKVKEKYLKRKQRDFFKVSEKAYKNMKGGEDRKK